MKRLRELALSLCAVVLMLAQGSCVVRSIHPWFPESDVVHEQDLLGGWVGTDGGRDVAMTFVSGQKNDYFMQYQSGDTRGSFRALLGKLSGELYLDFRPVDNPSGVDGMLLFPTHSVAKIELSPERLVVRAMDYDEVKARAQGGKFSDLKYAWDEQNEVIINSRSDELRSFLVSHSRDKELYAAPLVMSRRK